jgi:hypothetical protein
VRVQFRIKQRFTYNTITKLRSTGSVLDNNKSRKRRALTKEKTDGIGTRLEASPGKQ